MDHSPDYLRRQAKALRKAHAAGDPQAIARVGAVLKEAGPLKHADALHVVPRAVRARAREGGRHGGRRLGRGGEAAGARAAA